MRQRGVAGLMAMIFLLLVVSLAAVTLLSMSSSDLHDTTAQNDGITALFAAETGLERASQLYASGTPCGAALLPLPAPAAPMAIGNRAGFQSTAVAPISLAGPVRCQLQVVGRAGTTIRTVQAALAGGTIAFVSASSSTANNPVASLTWNHTIPATAGANRVLLVGVSIRRTATEQVGAPAPTYGAQTLTYIGSLNHPASEVRVELFSLVNPSIGTNIPIVLNFSALARAQGGAVTLSGVDQTTPLDAAPIFASGNSAASWVSMATVTNNAWVVDTLGALLNTNASVGAGQLQQWNGNTGGGPANGILGAGSIKGPQAIAGPVSMSWGLSAAQPWVAGAVALRPAGRVYVMNWQEI
jgi:hypothetical protein